jgi:hypothetical protein
LFLTENVKWKMEYGKMEYGKETIISSPLGAGDKR